MIDQLRSVIHGEAIAPGDGAYDDVRRVWNGQIDRRPALVVRCVDADDVAAALRFADVRMLGAIMVAGPASPASARATVAWSSTSTRSTPSTSIPRWGRPTSRPHDVG